MRFYFTMIICILVTTITNAQSDGEVTGNQLEAPRVNVLPPQTYDFVKYGNQTVSYFNGEPEINVPVYTYTDRDFEIPISLGYNAAGFMPSKREGIVGLNWFLNSGAGVITRKVNGFPDEMIGNPATIPNPTLHGYYYGVKNRLMSSRDSLFTLRTGTVNGLNYFWGVKDCEAEPDNFNFRIPGQSGEFFIDANGSVKTSGGRPFKVDLTDFKLQTTANNSTLDETSEIRVTTDDGYLYIFGGGIQYLEIGYELPLPTWQISLYSAVIEAWHLRKIIAPNGRTVVFEYEEFIPGLNPGGMTVTDSRHYLLSVNDIQYGFVNSYFIHFETQYGARYTETEDRNDNGTKTLKSLTKTVYLKKILIGTTSIGFEYREKSKTFYWADNYNQRGLQLEGLSVRNKDELVKHFDFGYRYYGGVHSRQFLTSFKESGDGSSGFHFYYHQVDPHLSDTIALPPPTTRAIDHWGFWNGSTEFGKLIPELTFDMSVGDVSIVSSERNPDSTKCNVGLLAKMIYPTSGYSEFTYEPHHYSARIERRSADYFLPKLYNVKGWAGGARIKSIRDFDGEKYVNTREFVYVKDFASKGKEPSGILVDWPRYLIPWMYRSTNYNLNYVKMRSSTFNTNYYPGENFIQYEEVTVVNKGNSQTTSLNGFITYKFTSHRNRKNENVYVLTPVINRPEVTITNLHSYRNFVGIKFNNLSMERGLPYEVSTFGTKTDGSSYLVNKKVTTFSSHDNFPSAYTAGVHQTGDVAQSYKIYYHPVVPLNVVETRYANEGRVAASLITVNAFNGFGYQVSSLSYQSEGTTKKTKQRYLTDLIADADKQLLYKESGEVTPLYRSLPLAIKAVADLRFYNIIRKPVEVLEYTDEALTGSTYLEFKDFATTSVPLSKMIFPARVFSIKATPTTFAEATITKGASWQLKRSAAYDDGLEATFDSYDAFGNVLQITDRTSLRRSYQWGYDGLYPIAEAVGVPVSNFFYTGFEDEAGTTNPDCHTGEKLRLDGYQKVLKNLTPGPYTLTYWKKLPQGWTFVTNDVNVSGSTYNLNIQRPAVVDDVRFYPRSIPLLLNTYTYKPLTGMTSKTDPNHKTTFYEYDESGRLKLLRDHQGNIVRNYDYRFQLH